MDNLKLKNITFCSVANSSNYNTQLVKRGEEASYSVP
jgi:hypothetical protein